MESILRPAVGSFEAIRLASSHPCTVLREGESNLTAEDVLLLASEHTLGCNQCNYDLHCAHCEGGHGDGSGCYPGEGAIGCHACNCTYSTTEGSRLRALDYLLHHAADELRRRGLVGLDAIELVMEGQPIEWVHEWESSQGGGTTKANSYWRR